MDPFFPTGHLVQSVQDVPVNAVSTWYLDAGQLVQERSTEEEGVDPFFPAPQVDQGVHAVPVNELDA